MSKWFAALIVLMLAGVALPAHAGDGYRYWYSPPSAACRHFYYDPNALGDADRAKQRCEQATDETCSPHSAPEDSVGYVC